MSHTALQVLDSRYFTKSTCSCFINSNCDAPKIKRTEIAWKQITHLCCPSPSNADAMSKVVKEEFFLLNSKFKPCESKFINAM